ncbi:MAG: type II secretion system protein [Planctomycetota bacterium]|nr:type II secretion system protein [Planctomycetota bacterium]
MRAKNRRGGFTLIELLVVISIIAVLAGLVMTATMKVRQQSRKVQCSNNLRQIGIASQLYLNDYRIFPYDYGVKVDKDEDEDPFDDEDAGTQGYNHIQLLFNTNMLDNPEVVICGASTDQEASEDEEGIFRLRRMNCSYNWTKKPRGDGDRSTAPLAADRFEKSKDDDALESNNHADGRNVLHIDGSVKWVTSKVYAKKYADLLTDR